MGELRYLGIKIGDAGDAAGARTEPRLGRFISVSEPLPVGTLVELDGARHRVTRVEEGLTTGFWLRADGAAVPDVVPARPAAVEPEVPTALDDKPTLRELAPVPVPTAVEAEDGAPQAIDPAPPAVEVEAEAPKPVPDPEPSTKRKRRGRGKTIVGR